MRRSLLTASIGLALATLAVSCTSGQPPEPPSPVPSGQALASRECPIGLALLRGPHVGAAQTVDAMKGHVPGWLPDGFGLAVTTSIGGGGVAATWVDERCREVSVIYIPQALSGTPTHVGVWVLTVNAPARCGNHVLGTATCLGYVADGLDGSVSMQAVGIDKSVGDRIVASIPL